MNDSDLIKKQNRWINVFWIAVIMAVLLTVVGVLSCNHPAPAIQVLPPPVVEQPVPVPQSEPSLPPTGTSPISFKETNLGENSARAVGTIISAADSSITFRAGKAILGWECTSNSDKEFCRQFKVGDPAPFTYTKDSVTGEITVTEVWSPDEIEVIKEFSK
jgi:hypothetical protein